MKELRRPRYGHVTGDGDDLQRSLKRLALSLLVLLDGVFIKHSSVFDEMHRTLGKLFCRSKIRVVVCSNLCLDPSSLYDLVGENPTT